MSSVEESRSPGYPEPPKSNPAKKRKSQRVAEGKLAALDTGPGPGAKKLNGRKYTKVPSLSPKARETFERLRTNLSELRSPSAEEFFGPGYNEETLLKALELSLSTFFDPEQPREEFIRLGFATVQLKRHKVKPGKERGGKVHRVALIPNGKNIESLGEGDYGTVYKVYELTMGAFFARKETKLRKSKLLFNDIIIKVS